MGQNNNIYVAFNTFLSYQFKFTSFTRAMENRPMDHFWIKSQLHKILRLAEKSPPFYILEDIEKKPSPGARSLTSSSPSLFITSQVIKTILSRKLSFSLNPLI